MTLALSPSFCTSAQRMKTRSVRSNTDEVYVAAVPLRGSSKGPAQFLLSTAYSFNLWHFNHFMIIIKPNYHNSSSSSFHPQVLVYDFQPQDPEDIFVALAALSGRKVPGVILVRKLSKVPKTKCWFVGYSKENINAIDAAAQFNEKWETDLRIGRHDCRNYCEGLVEYLTGSDQKFVLEDLRLRDSSFDTP